MSNEEDFVGDWVGGNGRTYQVAVSKSKLSDDIYLCAWLYRGGTGGAAMIFDRGRQYNPSLVAEKMGIGHPDAVAILKFLNERISLKYHT